MEELPAGAGASLKIISCAISLDGSRMMVGCYGRLYSYYDGTWTEEQPAGAADKNWVCCDINNDGAMIAGISGGRLYVKAAGGAWAETRPLGDANKSWRNVCISADGTKYLASIYNGSVYRYESGAWTVVDPNHNYLGQYYGISYYYVALDCDADAEIIAMGERSSGPYVFCNAAMNEVHAQHNWPQLTKGIVTNAPHIIGIGVSADGSLIVESRYNTSSPYYGRIYVYDKNVMPDQISGGYRKEFTYTRPEGTAYNHKVQIRVYNNYTDDTYLHCEGRANDDFSDIYFKNAAGDTLRHCVLSDDTYQNSIELGYYRYVWVELDEVGTSPTTFYMHYGDSEHTDSSTAPASFFDVYDDFERGSAGDAVGGAWTVTAGTVKIVTDYPWKGTRCAEFVGAAARGTATIPIAAGDDMYIRFRENKHSSGGLAVSHGDGDAYAKFAHGTDETIKNYTGGAYEASVYNANYVYWRQFELLGFDWEAETPTYDLYIDGTKRGDAFQMQGGAGFTDILQLENLATANYYTRIDSLIACTNCNPFAVVDSESIGEEETIGEVVYSGPAGVKTWNEVASANIKTWNDISWNTIKAMN